MSPDPENDEIPYVVTRGKPPREHQFKPGKSGNPSGRPKGSKQIDALLEEELDRKIEVTLSGRRKKLTKRQIMVRQLVDKALKGDHKAIATCLALQKSSEGKRGDLDSSLDDMDALVAQNEQILAAYIARSAGTKADD